MKIIDLKDKEYPRLLKEIPNPPEKIFVEGELLPDELCFAVVGTRRPTSYGIEAAKYFTRGLSEAGFTIVSGLALGIDAICHQEALDCGKRTIAILGCDLKNIGPKTNEKLARKIIDQGALISEFPENYPTLPRNFAQRDRIMSGLSVGTLVIEAAERSGALITARNATEQGREVFAVPGEIFSLNSKGANKLIQEGAKLVSTTEDIFEEFSGIPEIFERLTKQRNLFQEEGLDKTMLQFLGEPKTVGEICELTGFSSSEISSKLTILELKNILKRRKDGRFYRV